MTTRWDKWFADENLARDERILAAPHSECAERAALAFLAREKRSILDLACGIGRDTFYLESRQLGVVGTDASPNGLRVAQRIRSKRRASAEFVVADARHLPFRDSSFEGVYSFGLLHEFTGERAERDVEEVMAEIVRVLCHRGVLVLTVQAGDPEAGLPFVQLFNRRMFDRATRSLRPIEIDTYDDIGCTAQTNYRVWYGLFEKQVGHPPVQSG